MSILVAKLFDADMSSFEFVFSKSACAKTGIYFTIMYLAVMIFNTITISRYKLINLLHANRKNETIKLKNPLVSILVFIIASSMLGYAYYLVTTGIQNLDTIEKMLIPIILGIVSTILIFWSLSGFILKIMQTMKNTYFRGTNMFIIRQLNNKINTTVISMSVICLMLFMTLTILSSSLSLRSAMQNEIKEMTPVDLNLSKTANLPETFTKKDGEIIRYSQEKIENSKIWISETLSENGFDMNLFKDVEEILIYTSENLTWEKFFGDTISNVKSSFPQLKYDTLEKIIKISDYNRIAKLYGNEEYELQDDEYIVLCDFDSMQNIRNMVLNSGNTRLEIEGKIYKSKYNECKSGFVFMSTNHINTGIILVPDNCNLGENNKDMYFLATNYNTNSDEEKEEIQKIFENDNSELLTNLRNKDLKIDGMSKISIISASVGLGTIVTFIAIYLGIIFLIASSAILALKQLTESTDNKERYTVLRRIGCDEKMINNSLFWQIGIFFLLPLIIAIIHSAFGIQFVMSMLTGLYSKNELLPSIIGAVCALGIIYGAYFMATYFGSKNIIKED